MAEVPPQTTNQKSLLEKIKTYLPFVAVVGTVVTLLTFFGLKPEKKKMLEWQYLSQNSLVNTSAAGSENIKVFYENREMRQLTVLAIRLVNIGDIPVDASDVKDGGYSSVTFATNLSVISSTIKERHPSNITAKVHFSTNNVTIEHGLLNPTDYIGFQIVVEGDPGPVETLPAMNCRVVGITSPSTRYPISPSTQPGIVAFFPGRPNLQLLILIIGSFLPAIGLVATLVLGWDLVQTFSSIDEAARSAQANVRRELRHESIGMNMIMTSELKDDVKRLYAFQFKAFVRRAVDQGVRRIPIRDGETVAAFLERADEVVRNLSKPGLTNRLKSFDKEDLFLYPLIVLMTISASLVYFRPWYELITGWRN